MTEIQKYKCFIIHLKRAKKRKPYVDDLISMIDMKTEIIDAVDGKLLTKHNILKYYSKTPLYRPIYPFKVNNGEIGCFLSFRKAWQNIVDQNLSSGLIFEDDVSLDLDIFNESLASALEWVDTYGYIQFQVRKIPKKSKLLKSNQNIRLFQPSPILLRCSAQLVSYSAAKKLLKITEKFDRPIDTFLQTNWNTGLKISCIEPSGVIDNTFDSGGSNLSLQIPLILRMNREYNRIKYRHNVRKFAFKYNKI
jgi:glycosyl transferase, family 25